MHLHAFEKKPCICEHNANQATKDLMIQTGNSTFMDNMHIKILRNFTFFTLALQQSL